MNDKRGVGILAELRALGSAKDRAGRGRCAPLASFGP
jgi:hypothetical protein